LSARNIVTNFLRCVDELKEEGILTNESLKEYQDHNIHSYLQYCLIMGAYHGGFRGIPEYKLKLSKPLDKHQIDSRLKSKRIRYTRTIRVDVGFLKERELVGIGEIYTPDEIHGCLPSTKLQDAWVTPHDKLVHIVKHEESIKFLILVIGLWTLPPWKDARKKTPQEWYKHWKTLVKQISGKKNTIAIYIKGLNDIETNPLHTK